MFFYLFTRKFFGPIKEVFFLLPLPLVVAATTNVDVGGCARWWEPRRQHATRAANFGAPLALLREVKRLFFMLKSIERYLYVS